MYLQVDIIYKYIHYIEVYVFIYVDSCKLEFKFTLANTLHLTVEYTMLISNQYRVASLWSIKTAVLFSKLCRPDSPKGPYSNLEPSNKFVGDKFGPQLSGYKAYFRQSGITKWQELYPSKPLVRQVAASCINSPVPKDLVAMPWVIPRFLGIFQVFPINSLQTLTTYTCII